MPAPTCPRLLQRPLAEFLRVRGHHASHCPLPQRGLCKGGHLQGGQRQLRLRCDRLAGLSGQLEVSGTRAAASTGARLCR